MKEYCCNKCGSTDVFIDDRGNQKALICGDCGKWLKWIGKKELPLVEKYIKSKSHEKESCDNYNDCRVCGEYKKVHECAREIDGYQRLVFICDSCLKWIKEL